jgi:hypothetical protein
MRENSASVLPTSLLKLCKIEQVSRASLELVAVTSSVPAIVGSMCGNQQEFGLASAGV